MTADMARHGTAARRRGGWRLQVLAWLALFVCGMSAVAAEEAVDAVRVVKSERTLYLMSAGQVVKAFPVVFGPRHRGHKQERGDERTPEGSYVLDYKKADSPFYRAIHISYPNAADRDRARTRGVDPGGDIMIHGQPKDLGRLAQQWAPLFNWTDGCIALANDDMDEVWARVKVGTPIEILP